MSSPGTRQIQNIDKAYKTGIETRFNCNFCQNTEQNWQQLTLMLKILKPIILCQKLLL